MRREEKRKKTDLIEPSIRIERLRVCSPKLRLSLSVELHRVVGRMISLRAKSEDEGRGKMTHSNVANRRLRRHVHRHSRISTRKNGSLDALSDVSWHGRVHSKDLVEDSSDWERQKRGGRIQLIARGRKRRGKRSDATNGISWNECQRRKGYCLIQ